MSTPEGEYQDYEEEDLPEYLCYDEHVAIALPAPKGYVKLEGIVYKEDPVVVFVREEFADDPWGILPSGFELQLRPKSK